MTFSVKPISITKGLDELEGRTAQEIISYCARVSNPNNQTNFNTSSGLLKFCIREQHWSIFEMASMCVEIKTSRAISPQILRHRSFSFSEFSQRYAIVKENGFIAYEPRRQDTKNRQNSIDDIDESTKKWFEEAQLKVWEASQDLYKEAINKGIAKESARFLLPLNAETTLYMNGTVRSWIHYLLLRTDESTQKEHRDIAEAIKKIFYEQFPDIAQALEETA